MSFAKMGMPMVLAALVTGSLSDAREIPGTVPDIAVKADALISQYADRGQFSGAVLISMGDQVILRRGYGKSDSVRGIDNTPETKFPIASLTKQFTAAAIYLLQEQGKLQVRDALGKFFPSLPPAARSITLQQLLNHTSGIPDYEEIEGIHAIFESSAAARKLVDVLSGKGMHLHFTPGKAFEYSNTNFTLLGIIIEKASGVSYEQYLSSMQRRLGLSNTGVYRRDSTSETFASGHQPVAKAGVRRIPMEALEDLSRLPGDGGLYSTVDDLVRWTRALVGGKLLGKQGTEAMLRPHKDGYGSGLNFGWKQGHRAVFHGGDMDGFRSYLIHLTAHDATVVVLSNLETSSEKKIAGKLAALLSRGLD